MRSSRSPARVSVRAKPKIVASGVRRSWHASETTRGNPSSAIVALRFYPMAKTRNTPTADMQASAPEIQLGLTRAGVTGVQKAIRIRHEGHEKTFAAEISCTVDLDPSRKASTCRAFRSCSARRSTRSSIGEAFLVETLAEHIARHIVERQHALRAEVRIEAQYPLERRTPVTGLPTQEIATLIGIAAASPDGVRRVVGVEAWGINACPCAQGLVRGAASDRLLEAGFADGDDRPHPRARPARDPQPAREGNASRRDST